MIPKSSEPLPWEKIVDEIEREGGSLRWGRAELRGRTLWRVEVVKGDGRWFIAQTEELPVAFAELHRMLSDDTDPATPEPPAVATFPLGKNSPARFASRK